MGKVYLVGAGPGDPELITVKALKAIQKADVILYDRLINEDLLMEAKPGADLIFCGKLPNFHTLKQETINHFLVKYARMGKTVTRLKGGDPFVFGRGGEEAEELSKHNIPFEIVPGITSGIAAPAYAGIPVTHRELSGSFAIVTGHRCKGLSDDMKWNHLSKSVDTLVIYMGMNNLSYICEQLMENGKAPTTPVGLIHWGTTERQETVIGTLKNIVEQAEKAKVKNPSMIVIGEVVKLRSKIQWFEQLKEDSYIKEAF